MEAGVSCPVATETPSWGFYCLGGLFLLYILRFNSKHGSFVGRTCVLCGATHCDGSCVVSCAGYDGLVSYKNGRDFEKKCDNCLFTPKPHRHRSMYVEYPLGHLRQNRAIHVRCDSRSFSVWH